MAEFTCDVISVASGLTMNKLLVIVVLLLLSVACGAAAVPTPAPSLAPSPAPTATLPPTPTDAPEPTATPLPTATPAPEPTATQAVPVELATSQEEAERRTSALDSVFPEIYEKMQDIRPVYIAYYHSEDWQVPGQNTTVDEVFKLLKMENIVTHEGRQQISPAMVVDLEPDLIIADSIEAVVKNPALSGLHMVSDAAHIPHHIFVMKEGYSFYVADPGFRDTVQAFAAFAYPDTFVFADVPTDDHGAGQVEGEKDEPADDHSHGPDEGGHGH
ncbi:MAG: hypothetical protein OXR67_02500 [Chloroflexota bacterium]|nr:hypothetical protein [Chloroflexota bacterium]